MIPVWPLEHLVSHSDSSGVGALCKWKSTIPARLFRPFSLHPRRWQALSGFLRRGLELPRGRILLVSSKAFCCGFSRGAGLYDCANFSKVDGWMHVPVNSLREFGDIAHFLHFRRFTSAHSNRSPDQAGFRQPLRLLYGSYEFEIFICPFVVV